MGVAGYCWFLGYFGGPIYTQIPAAAAPGMVSRRETVAIYFSGDLGFNTGMGPKISRELANKGIPVLGVNSLTLFAREQSPAAASAIVRRAVDRALAISETKRLILIGQSFGANVLIEGLQGLSPSRQARVAMVALVTPSDTTLLQASPGGLIDLVPAIPPLPAARALKWAPVLCVQGQDEGRSLCPQWRQSNVRTVALPGGHFLNSDTALVARTILRAIPAGLHASLPNVEAP